MSWDYGDSTFISASHNTLYIVYYDIEYISSNGGPQRLTQRCVYANSVESVTNERDFFPSVTWTEGESETALLETVHDLLFLLRNEWVDF